MPVFLNPKHPDADLWSGLNWPLARLHALRKPRATSRRITPLHLGLVNNMADAGMEATEHQFLALLEAAAGDRPVRITFFALPEIERNLEAQRRVDSFYFGVERLWQQPPEQWPDGLIVTGREPLTADLRDETYWPSLKRLLAWTQMHSRSAVWSCLAAHAAVLALDGIERVRSPQKQFGIFTCQQMAPHDLLAGAPVSLRMPHSRWNGLCADQLASNGYQVLTYNRASGVDTFVKQGPALFVFLQGHPEYESETLMREYRRDVGRYLRGEMETYPLPPAHYFDAGTERSLREMEAKAGTSCPEQLVGEVSAVLNRVQIDNTWRGTATLIYRNWLDYLWTQRHLQGNAGSTVAGARPASAPATGTASMQNEYDLRQTYRPIAAR